jgi:SPX domain protein involved in polyphosphate accumulation
MKEEEVKLNEAIKALYKVINFECVSPAIQENASALIFAKEELNRRNYIKSLEDEIEKFYTLQEEYKKELIDKIGKGRKYPISNNVKGSIKEACRIYGYNQALEDIINIITQ